jgi:NADH:ubiquinone oxidoreductase subunit 5 (subunit L)/multisubunit Na+/H+ antiporter MnhA subunit
VIFIIYIYFFIKNISLYFYLFILIAGLCLYLLGIFFLQFFYKFIGSRGFFIIVQFLIVYLFCLLLRLLFIIMQYNITCLYNIGDLFFFEDLCLNCLIKFDILSILGCILVLILTFITLFFGVEYMTREAFIYNVLSLISVFSASIL